MEENRRKKRVLFVCLMGRDRSRQFAEMAAATGEVETDYGGTDPSADRPLTHEMLMWADVVYCAEVYHREKIRSKKPWKGVKKDGELFVLGVPDDYKYGTSELEAVVLQKLPRVLSNPSIS